MASNSWVLGELERKRRARELDHAQRAQTPGTPGFASAARKELFPSPASFVANTPLAMIPGLGDVAEYHVAREQGSGIPAALAYAALPMAAAWGGGKLMQRGADALERSRTGEPGLPVEQMETSALMDTIRQQLPGGGQAGIAMPIGGRSQVGMLGRKLPQVPENTLPEMLTKEGYQLGSAPGVYTHQGTPKAARVPAGLTAAERAMANEYQQRMVTQFGDETGARLGRQARDEITGYRSTHHPRAGWRQANPASMDVKLSRAGKPELDISYQQQHPEFHLDPKTGRALAGLERVDAVEKTSNAMVSEVEDLVKRAAEGDANAQFIVDQSRWYKDAERTIKGLFGEDLGTQYADIQASLSPNTKLIEQHKMANEVFNRMLGGEFEGTMARFDAHMAQKPPEVGDAQWAKHLRDPKSKYYDPDAIIRKKQIDPDTGRGMLYGMNSLNAQLAMRDKLRQLGPGMAPKMRNFAGNLGGTSVDPTIDVWAGRTVNRLMGGPRIAPKVDAGVPGAVAGNPNRPMLTSKHYDDALRARDAKTVPEGRQARMEADAQRTPAPSITGQYGVANDTFTAAAAKLGMDADDLQALMWFREKELWESRGWTPVDSRPSLVQNIQADWPVGLTPADQASALSRLEAARR